MTTNYEIARTIISQMGGFTVLKLFVNARSFVADENSVIFKFSGSRVANYCKVVYNYGLDEYEMHLIKINGSSRKEKIIYGVFCDTLVEVFERNTGLYLHF